MYKHDDSNDPIDQARKRNDEAAREACKVPGQPPATKADDESGVSQIDRARRANELAGRQAWRGDKGATYANLSGPTPSQDPMQVQVGQAPGGGTVAARPKESSSHDECPLCANALTPESKKLVQTRLEDLASPTGRAGVVK